MCELSQKVQVPFLSSSRFIQYRLFHMINTYKKMVTNNFRPVFPRVQKAKDNVIMITVGL